MTAAPDGVLVLQHTHEDGPAWLGHWLDREGVRWSVRNAEAGDDYPSHIDGWRALAVLGGEMGANDDLPHLRRAEDLIRQAVAAGVPVIGHCLGGQLMARALGGRVGPSPAPEVGWCELRVHRDGASTRWFGDEPTHRVYQWHYDAFTPPPGAVPLAASDACGCQAFALGPHLGLQFHVELDAEKLARWAASHEPRWAAARAAHPATVSDAAAMLAQGGGALDAQRRRADRLYRHWLGGA